MSAWEAIYWIGVMVVGTLCAAGFIFSASGVKNVGDPLRKIENRKCARAALTYLILGPVWTLLWPLTLLWVIVRGLTKLVRAAR